MGIRKRGWYWVSSIAKFQFSEISVLLFEYTQLLPQFRYQSLLFLASHSTSSCTAATTAHLPVYLLRLRYLSSNLIINQLLDHLLLPLYLILHHIHHLQELVDLLGLGALGLLHLFDPLFGVLGHGPHDLPGDHL